MKKFLSLILIACLLASTVACGDKNEQKEPSEQTKEESAQEKEAKSEVFINEEYNRENMKNISGSVINLEERNILYGNQANGYVISSNNFEENLQNPLGISPLGLSDKVYTCTYVPKKYIDILCDEEKIKTMTEEEITNMYKEVFENSFEAYSFVIIDKGDKESKELYDNLKEKYEFDDLLCSTDESEYHMIYNKDYSKYDLLDEDKHDIDLMIQEYKDIEENLVLFSKKDPEALSKTSNMNNFTTKDVEGNEVTDDIFAEYDLTMVNIWATHCGPCIDEMDELQQLYEKLPDGVNLISVCEDGADELELTKEILEKKGVKFQTLVSSDSLKSSLLKNISATPTTIFVDKDGNIVGEEIVGAPGLDDEVITNYLKSINNLLEK